MSREAQLKNANISVMRALLKDCKAPDLYWGEVPCHDPKTQTDGHMTKLPFILPHELLKNMLGKDAKLLGELASNPLLPGVEQFKDSFCEKFEVPATQCLGLGVFGDGVPHQKNKSVECVTWNILGQGANSQRYLFTCIPKNFTCKCGCSGRHTMEAIFNVLVYSFVAMSKNLWPQCRHDEAPWSSEDKGRAKKKGPLGFFAALLQVRGDWSWYKQIFAFPSWSSHHICWRCKFNSSNSMHHIYALNLAICWRCNAGKEEDSFKDTSKKATWRKKRLTTTQFFRKQRECGAQPSTLFRCPGRRRG